MNSKNPNHVSAYFLDLSLVEEINEKAQRDHVSKARIVERACEIYLRSRWIKLFRYLGFMY